MADLGVTPARAAAGVSAAADPHDAGREAAAAAAAGLQGAPVDLALVFVSAHHAPAAERVTGGVFAGADPRRLAGVSSLGVSGGGTVTDQPAVCVLALSLPGTAIGVHPIATTGGGAVMNVPSDFEAPDAADGAVVVLADPFTFPVATFLRLLEERWGGALAVGGLASGGSAPGDHALLCDRGVLRRGAIVLTFSGGVSVHALVSQGCEPVGPDMVVTAAAGRVITGLAGRPAYERLIEVVEALPAGGRERVSEGLTLGSVIDENCAEHGRGDYLIRGVVGVDPESGAIVLGGLPRVGQTMRFHLRDSGSADRDLRAAIEAERSVLGERLVAGLLFSCTGRWSGPPEARNDDAATLAEELPQVPGIGMLCSGEIGPVGGVSFVHGFTATMALLVANRAAEAGGGVS